MNIKNLRLSGICYESLVNGPGIRRVIFAQGCIHNCKGCFNPDTHDFNGGEEREIASILKDIKENPLLQGVTFSGGDPFEQAEGFALLAKGIKEMGLNIWCYTGYTIEYILQNLHSHKGFYDLLSNIDVLVDGEFIEEKADSTLKFRGSSNQRIINVPESLERMDAVAVDLED